MPKIDTFKAPFHVAINITSNCQANCAYCYSFNDNRYIDLEKFKTIVDELVAMEVFEFCLAGGEPFLHPNAVEMIEYLATKANGRNISLVNNGMSITKDKAKQLFKILRVDLKTDFSPQVSVDSNIDEINKITRAGTRVKAIERGIRAWQEAGFKNVHIGTVLSKSNFDKYESLVGYYYEQFDIRHFHLMHLERPNHRDKQILNQFTISHSDYLHAMETIQKIKQKYPDISIIDAYTPRDKSDQTPTLKGKGCTAGVTHCEILANLDVIPCGMASQFVLGSLKHKSFSEIWNGSMTNAIRNQSSLLCDKNTPQIAVNII